MAATEVPLRLAMAESESPFFTVTRAVAFALGFTFTAAVDFDLGFAATSSSSEFLLDLALEAAVFGRTSSSSSARVERFATAGLIVSVVFVRVVVVLEEADLVRDATSTGAFWRVVVVVVVVDVEMGTALLGGCSLEAMAGMSGVSSAVGVLNLFFFHFEGLSAQAST